MARGETASTCDEYVLFDCRQLPQALLDDNTIVTNANRAPNDNLTNMEIMIIAIIAPMNTATVFNFYYLLAATEYALLVSIVLRIECKCMCKSLPLVCDDQNVNYVKS
jgi:hypothetical protein